MTQSLSKVEGFEENYSCINFDYDFNSTADINAQVNHYLKQFPDETVNLNLIIRTSKCASCQRTVKSNPNHYNNCSCTSSKINFEIYLKFTNSIHYISESYTYKIITKMTIFQNDSVDERVLFCGQKARKADSIEFKDVYIDNNYLNKSCKIKFTILLNRFCNEKKIEDDHLESVALLYKLIENPKFGDILVKVQDQTFYALEEVLVEKSSVFQTMLKNEMSENINREIQIEDFDAEVVKEMLLFLHCNGLMNLYRMPIPLYEIAHKYEIDNLKEKSLEWMKFNLTLYNCIPTLKFTVIYELTSLRNSILEYINDHEAFMIKRTDYKEFLIICLTVARVAYTLRLCSKYPSYTADTKEQIFHYIKENIEEVNRNVDFLLLFNTHPQLMKELFIYINKK